MRVVTSGFPYLDIDAYACCIAYAELLNLLHKDAIAASSSAWNESITQTVRSWKTNLKTDYQPSKEDVFILVDVSDPKQFDKFVDTSKISEVIDHHPSLEKYWQKRIGNNAIIDFIGAASTLIYEKWLEVGLLEKMSPVSARLLATGILDNTLNFGAHVTTQRDKKAYLHLLTRANLPSNWIPQYFNECQKNILADVSKAIHNDTKLLNFSGLAGSIAFGQLVVWDAQEVIVKYLQTIEVTMNKIKSNWFANIVSINEGKSYFIAKDSETKEWAEKLLDIKFSGSVANANRLWLRKEVIKQDLQLVLGN